MLNVFSVLVHVQGCDTFVRRGRVFGIVSTLGPPKSKTFKTCPKGPMVLCTVMGDTSLSHTSNSCDGNPTFYYIGT